jgi:5'(3')-deoxyribonucleotidase
MKEVFLKDKLIGYIDENTYYTSRNPKEHFFRKRQGYPISVSILNYLKELKIKYIVITEYNRNDKQKKRYRCFLSDFDFIESFIVNAKV